MENYYFIEQNGIKKGPLKLTELKEQKIYFDDLVWRSDSENWKKAIEFNELKEIYLIKPPLTPLEIKKNLNNKNFVNKVLPSAIGSYFAISIIITILSFSIANNDWENIKNSYLMNKEEVGKPSNEIESHQGLLLNDSKKLKRLRKQYNKVKKFVEPIIDSNKKTSNSEKDSLDKYYSLYGEISRIEIDSSYHNAYIYEYNSPISTINKQEIIKPIYKIPENIISLENINAIQQPFLLRPFYAFFSKIYLTREEQNNSGSLLTNLAQSSFVTMFIVVLFFLMILYTSKYNK
jgi:hypothetical protein